MLTCDCRTRYSNDSNTPREGANERQQGRTVDRQFTLIKDRRNNRDESDCPRNDMTDSDEDWTKQLSTCQNITDGLLPYLPIPIEKIPRFIMLKDFEKSCVRSVVTLGLIKEEGPEECLLLSFVAGKDVGIPLSFENFSEESTSPSTSDGPPRRPWVPGQVYKIWAMVSHDEGQPVLCVHRLKHVTDRYESLETLTALFKLVRYRIFLYSPSKEERLHHNYAFTYEWLMKKRRRGREST